MNLEATLTPREEQVAERVARGYIKKEIASDLFISEHTVVNHLRSIYEKTESRSVGQLSAWWFCKTFGLVLKPLAVIFLVLLLGANEFNTTDDHAIKTGRIRTVRVRKGKRNEL